MFFLELRLKMITTEFLFTTLGIGILMKNNSENYTQGKRGDVYKV